jgi:hypothetical protein
VSDPGGWPAQVELVQPLPSERSQILHLISQGPTSWVAKCPATPLVRSGEFFPLSFQPEDAHLFDTDSGERIS